MGVEDNKRVRAKLEQDNMKLKAENQQLEIKAAVLDERCQRYEETIQSKVDENTSLRGEVSDMRDGGWGRCRLGSQTDSDQFHPARIGADSEVSEDGDACDASSVSLCVCASVG